MPEGIASVFLQLVGRPFPARGDRERLDRAQHFNSSNACARAGARARSRAYRSSHLTSARAFRAGGGFFSSHAASVFANRARSRAYRSSHLTSASSTARFPASACRSEFSDL
jgi:hypothetical protein